MEGETGLILNVVPKNAFKSRKCVILAARASKSPTKAHSALQSRLARGRGRGDSQRALERPGDPDFPDVLAAENQERRDEPLPASVYAPAA